MFTKNSYVTDELDKRFKCRQNWVFVLSPSSSFSNKFRTFTASESESRFMSVSLIVSYFLIAGRLESTSSTSSKHCGLSSLITYIYFVSSLVMRFTANVASTCVNQRETFFAQNGGSFIDDATAPALVALSLFSVCS